MSGLAMMASKMILPFTVKKVVKMAARCLPSFLKRLMSWVISPCRKDMLSGPLTDKMLREVSGVTQPLESNSL